MVVVYIAHRPEKLEDKAEWYHTQYQFAADSVIMSGNIHQQPGDKRKTIQPFQFDHSLHPDSVYQLLVAI